MRPIMIEQAMLMNRKQRRVIAKLNGIKKISGLQQPILRKQKVETNINKPRDKGNE